ncbi:hydroxyphenylacetyl-CoA thioesterase PaaI [Hydrogenophaga sp. 5NK40-0174]|uniref:hydroxyphenylacetyl-CoA thioesterase PaaI n=1 Tax=Hydrogenophaga sp. 5NK40-0174 TaxID=3127649 RepID=UPI003108AE89
MTPQQTAEHVREQMLANDAATRWLGIDVIAIGPGTATATMTVRKEMLNGHATCHGGLITALADSAFAFACNACNELTVASGLSVDFLAPGREGDVLTAKAVEVSAKGRTGVYDVSVHNQDGVAIAVFRGRSYRAKGRPAVGDNAQ